MKDNDIRTKLRRLLARNDLLLATCAGVAVITAGVFLGWYNNKTVPLNPIPLAHYTQEPNNPLSFMSNWDGPDYMHIVANGYSSTAETNFFPLYPIIVRAVNVALGSPLISALIVSWVAFIGAIFFFIKILKKLYGVKRNSESVRGLIFFIFFPTAIFFIATYTEALFTLVALGAIYYTLEKKYLPAALLAILCSATHVTGVFVLVLLGLIMLEQKAGVIKSLAVPVIGSLGLVAYMVYLWERFKQPLAFVTSQQTVHGWTKGTYSTLVTSTNALNIFFILLLLAAIAYWWPKRKSFSIYSALFLLIPILGKEYGGFNRYVLVAFPVQFMLYEYFRDKKTAYTIAATLSGILWSFYMLRYAGGYIGS